MQNLFIYVSCFFLSITFMYGQENHHIIEQIREFNVLINNNQHKEALNLIKKQEDEVQENNPSQLPQIYHLYSKYYLFISEFEKGAEYAEKALASGEESNDELGKAFGLYSMAYYYYQMDLMSEAYEYLQQIVKEVDLNKYPYLGFQVYYKLYGVHTLWNEAEKTNKYAQQSVVFANKINDGESLSNAYSAKAYAMSNMFNATQNKEYQDSVLYYLSKSANLDYSESNKISIRTKTIANINLADYYFQKFRNREINYPMAKDSMTKYLERAEDIPQSIDFNYELRANILGMKSQLALAEGNVELTESYLLTAYHNLEKEQQRPAFQPLYNVTIGLYELYKAKEDYKKAFDYLKINQAYKDSIFNKSKIKEVHTLEAKYENERIKEELTYLEKENQFEKIQKYLLIVICVLVLVILVTLRKNHLKKLAIESNKALVLKKEKAEAEAQVNLEKEKQARVLAERKILKLENEKIQKELLVHVLQIKRKNELLDELKSQFKESDNINDFSKTFKLEKRLEESLNNTVKEFEEINPLFFERLGQHSNGKLTPLDMKYSAYFHLGLSTKEIAQIFNVEPKSIRMTKYRIKQKLNLPKEQTIEEFFEQIAKA